MGSYFQAQLAAYAALSSFTSGVVKCDYNTEVIDIEDENTTKCPENASISINDVPGNKENNESKWEDVISSSRNARNEKYRIGKTKPKSTNGTNNQSGSGAGLTKKQLRIAKLAQRNASQSEKNISQNSETEISTKPRFKTIKQTRIYPELPKKYEEMIPTLNMTALLEISLWLNKYRETMNLFDDYADEVETETGLKISGRTKFMDEFDDYIHRAQYILKLRLYKLQ